MEKTVTIEGKEIKLRTHGNIPNLYKKQFGVDFINEMNKMNKGEISLEFFNNFLWLAAKEADKEILSPDEWSASFDSYPVMNVMEEVEELLLKLMNTGKKSVPPKVAMKNR